MPAMVNESYHLCLETARRLLAYYESANELVEANESINDALRQRPSEAPAWVTKSQILSALEDDVAALAAAEMAISLAPDLAEAHYIYAGVLVDLERFDEADSALNKAFAQLDDQDDWLGEDLYYEKAFISEAMGNDGEAIKILEEGLQKYPCSALLSASLAPLRKQHVRRHFRVIEGGAKALR